METIFFWMTGAICFGIIFKILSLPILIGFIVAGYLLNVADLSGNIKLLDVPAEVGVELLLFSLGLKIKPSYFLNKGLIAVFFIHTIILSAIYFIFLDLNISAETKFFLSISLIFSSTIIASKSLESRKELNTFHGRLSIMILIFQDILALIILFKTNSNGLSFNSLYLLILPLAIPVIKFLLSHVSTSKELELMTVIFIALFLGGELFKAAGFTGEIGALFIGIMLSNYKNAERLAESIWSIREILLVAFFLSLGMKLTFNLEIFILAIFILSLLVTKSLGLYLLLIFFKLRAYTSFLIVITLCTYSEFALIIASRWFDLNVVNESIMSSLTLAVCLSLALGSILNKHVHEIFVYFESVLIKIERQVHHPDEEPHTCGEAQVMILGMGRIGNAIFEDLSKNKIRVVGFDADTDLVKTQLINGKRVTFADAEDPGFWSKLRFGKLEAIILALPEFHSQVWSIEQARKFGFDGKIIVTTRSQGDPKILKEKGADEIYDAYQAAGLGVTELLIKLK